MDMKMESVIVSMSLIMLGLCLAAAVVLPHLPWG